MPGTDTKKGETRLSIALIWAMARNRVIGRDNALPWRLPADLAHFKALTTGHPVIMGRRTFESLGRPLPNRINIVITRDPDFSPAGCLVAHSVDEAQLIASSIIEGGEPTVFVIGGSELYRQMLPLADRLYPTLIDADVDGDAWFPEFDWQDWQELERHSYPADEKNTYPYTFVALKRKTPQS